MRRSQFRVRFEGKGRFQQYLKSIPRDHVSCGSFHRLEVIPLSPFMRTTVNFGIELMDAALKLANSSNKRREIQYRDGLLLALESLWPIRRRSLGGMTISRGDHYYCSIRREKHLQC
jgi:hypothetical protein